MADKRDEERRQIKTNSTIPNGDAGLSPEEISKIIPPIDQVLEDEEIEEAVLYDRASRRERAKRKLAVRDEVIKSILESKGIENLIIVSEQCAGYSCDIENRPGLNEAIKIARERNIPIIIPTTSRLIRNQNFNSITNPNLSPTRTEMDKLLKVTKGVRIFTLSNHLMETYQEKSFLAELNMSNEFQTRGRKKSKSPGYKKRQRQQWLEYCVSRRKQGKSYREISKEVSKLSGYSIGFSTVKSWTITL